VFKSSDLVPSGVTAGLDTVAIRMPSNAIAQKLIEIADVPVAAPSANLSGKPSPTSAKHVIDDLSGKIECIIDGGDCEVGLESTVLDMSSDQPTILRPGGVTIEELRKVIPSVIYDGALKDLELIPKSPGMKYVHYAPEAEVYILENFDYSLGNVGKTEEILNKDFADKKVGFMGSKSFVKKFDDYYGISLGDQNDFNQIASNLFRALRTFDDKGIEVVISESFELIGVGHAIMNRLRKSAGYKTINL
jgi:L-threonylcarbamoyladenylate synthase